MKVLALDPGEKIGWARVNMLPGRVWRDDELVHGIDSLKDMALRLEKVYQCYDVVVMESWRLSASKARTFTGSSFPTVQFIGMVRLLSWLAPATRLVMQAPTIKETAGKTMRRLKPELFKVVGAPVAHDDGHDMDAILHLWHYTWTDHITEMPT